MVFCGGINRLGSSQRTDRENRFTSLTALCHQDIVMRFFISYSAHVFNFQAVVQMQKCLQQQVEQVDSLLQQADGHNLPAYLIQQATQLQVN